mmetsp:Transcript_125472/g.362994  ORF Transcript_125472/g.362994 Transcript_125472/m.362994 type:complete len:209 (+) Transcript_125472:2100-2726(+)
MIPCTPWRLGPHRSARTHAASRSWTIRLVSAPRATRGRTAIHALRADGAPRAASSVRSARTNLGSGRSTHRRCGRRPTVHTSACLECQRSASTPIAIARPGSRDCSASRALWERGAPLTVSSADLARTSPGSFPSTPSALGRTRRAPTSARRMCSMSMTTRSAWVRSCTLWNSTAAPYGSPSSSDSGFSRASCSSASGPGRCTLTGKS